MLATPAWQRLWIVRLDPSRQVRCDRQTGHTRSGLGSQTAEGMTRATKSGAGRESTWITALPFNPGGPPLARGFAGQWPLPAPAWLLGSQVLLCPLGPSSLWCLTQLCWHLHHSQLPSHAGHTGTGGPECQVCTPASSQTSASAAAHRQAGPPSSEPCTCTTKLECREEGAQGPRKRSEASAAAKPKAVLLGTQDPSV